jgi:hypothetical protein
MQIPQIISGGPGFTGDGPADAAGIAGNKHNPTQLPSESMGDGNKSISFGSPSTDTISGGPGNDIASLLNGKAGDASAGAEKSGVTGTLLKLSDATALVPGLSNAFKGAGNSDGSLGGMIKGLFTGSLDTAKTSVEGIAKGALQGEVSPTMMAKNAVAENYEQNSQTPDMARKLASMT